jgi:hypothetical protein
MMRAAAGGEFAILYVLVSTKEFVAALIPAAMIPLSAQPEQTPLLGAPPYRNILLYKEKRLPILTALAACARPRSETD